MQFRFDDGGRAAAGYRGHANDCVARSIAIATGIPYQEVYDALEEYSKVERTPKGARKSHPRTGVHKKTSRAYLISLGWVWHPTMFVGQGCKVHLRAEELPGGTLIVKTSKHMTVVKDGVIYDTYDPSRDETRCVYGYWTKGE